MARRRRSRASSRTLWIVGFLACIAAVWGYAHFLSPVLEGENKTKPVADGTPATPPAKELAARPAPSQKPTRLTATRGDEPPASAPAEAAPPPEPKRVPDAAAPEVAAAEPATTPRGRQLLAGGLEAYQRGDVLTARSTLSDAFELGLEGPESDEARALLMKISAETIFGPTITAGDPFVQRYQVQPGDTLGRIALQYAITDDLVARVNGLTDKHRIRVGQNLKVVQGPFSAVIDKKTFTLDLYLRDTFVKRYSVGLGANDGTPTGEWIVGTKLTNPTYYPPRGGAIIAADDPQNPLGEYWIELKGVSGEAVGQERYGIHGTIDPASIGQSMSMGCVRLRNEDVAVLFTLLISDKSRVIVK